MKTLVIPADEYGCGKLRMEWPAQYLRDAGHDGVNIVPPSERAFRFNLDQVTGRAVSMDFDTTGLDVIVFQRCTQAYVAQVIPWLRSQGVAVVVDVDDDLSAIHPANPAYAMLDPIHMIKGRRDTQTGGPYMHSWDNLLAACAAATMVTVSTPGLVKRYGRHGRVRVLPNYLPEHYYTQVRTDGATVGWPAALHSHPNDPAVVGSSIRRLVNERGVRFVGYGENTGLAKAFGLKEEPYSQNVDILDWPMKIAELGVGIAPLADTTFNSRKSWLKPLELSAVGVPWVASPRNEYRRLHGLGAGLMADSPREWYDTLSRLVSSPGHRAELSERGRVVADGLRLRDHAGEYLAAWTAAADYEQNMTRKQVTA